MNESNDINYWLVGSMIDGDKSYDFVKGGYWEHAFEHKYSQRVKSIKSGDKIALKSSYVKKNNLPFDNHGKHIGVMKIKAIGTVVENIGDGKKLIVDWDKDFKEKEIYSFTYRNTCSKIDKTKWKDPIEWIFYGKEQDTFIIQNNEKETNMQTKNIILYGPPGVGKTYNHKKIISMIESEDYGQKEIFDAIVENSEDFDTELFETVKSENRFKFVTFHQSYSYEDFIEGFRPQEDGNIELVDGIFKEIAQKASDNLESSKKEQKFDFETFLNDFIQDVEQKDNYEIDNNLTIAVKKKSNGEFQSFQVGGRVQKQSLTKDVIKRDFESFLDGNIKTFQDVKPSFQSQNRYHGNAPYYFKLYQKMKKFLDESGNSYSSQKVEQKNFYILIDEINRGNISKIFGELITLIEDDKRDEIEVTLPYSKELFKVPSNLYIIATMNSTDKSIALIDVALRRRFTFLKMRPNAGLVNEDAREIFEKLNDFIADRLDEDYQIGHSYFMGDDIEFVLEYKIKPLLEEYFYHDRDSLKEILEKIYID